MKYSDIQMVAEDQKNVLDSSEPGTNRELLPSLPVTHSHALVVSGIRRCGKSVLLHQFFRSETDNVFYFNFADIRLYEFSAADFPLLDDLVKASGKNILFSDGISECDFIFQMNDGYKAMQVCYEINRDNQEREISGLLATLCFFKLSEGIILTVDQTDKIFVEGMTNHVLPAFLFKEF